MAFLILPAKFDSTYTYRGCNPVPSGVSAKISLNPRHDLQHIQRPTPPHLSKNAPSLSGLSHADVTRSRRRRVISAVEPGEPTSNFQQRDNAFDRD